MLFSKRENPALDCSDPGDFRKIYDSVFVSLFKVAYRIVSDEEAAEDLVHDTFIKASEKKMVFDTMNDATFWMIRVVKNAALNYAKRKTIEANAYHKVLYEGRQHMESGEVDLLKKETVKAATEALAKLPDNLKEVLVLKEYAGMSYKEIGDQLGITEGNVKVRVFRARAKLLELLGEDDVYLS
ncbi:MAG: sigma-70 family RNA polymerase sigma factor [Treponema sp.]|nr:sigma-70 family RNA polymerase sigma factor [Treponema sp.]